MHPVLVDFIFISCQRVTSGVEETVVTQLRGLPTAEKPAPVKRRFMCLAIIIHAGAREAKGCEFLSEKGCCLHQESEKRFSRERSH